MPRTKGSKNIQRFETRSEVASTSAKQIRHLARNTEATPLEQFRAQLRHQGNFLNWIDSRHDELMDVKRRLDPHGRGPKDEVYRKYRWYAAQQCLLEAINAFEVYYKTTLIGLARSIRPFVPPEQIRGQIDARVLWATRGSASFSALIFEPQLFHNLENVDGATGMLIGAKRYQPNNLKHPLRERVVALQTIFQIRHTLAHNQGHITQSDRAKFAALGYEAEHAEAIDPQKDNFGRSVRNFLENEADDFADWVLSKTASFLNERHHSAGIRLRPARKQRLERWVGAHEEIEKLDWE